MKTKMKKKKKLFFHIKAECSKGELRPCTRHETGGLDAFIRTFSISALLDGSAVTLTSQPCNPRENSPKQKDWLGAQETGPAPETDLNHVPSVQPTA